MLAAIRQLAVAGLVAHSRSTALLRIEAAGARREDRVVVGAVAEASRQRSRA